MKRIFVLLLAIASLQLSAQEYTVDAAPAEVGSFSGPSPLINSQDYTVYTSDYKNAKIKMERWISKHGYTIFDQNETKNSHHYSFTMPIAALPAVDSLVTTLGYISNKQLRTEKNDQTLADAQLELSNLLVKKMEYEKMQQRLDTTKSDVYYDHWQRTLQINEEILAKQKLIRQLQVIEPLINVSIDIRDEQVNPSNSKVSFVNMPGVQYSMLFVSNPQAGKSFSSYEGVSLKYLFTRGKSYASFGALKYKQKNPADSTAISEMFNLSFGQDFYGKRFGRGNNRFFNLYVGYQIGNSILYNKDHSHSTLFINPGMGLELIKTKSILLDVQGHYFTPLNNADNRTMRGWLTSASFSVVF